MPHPSPAVRSWITEAGAGRLPEGMRERLDAHTRKGAPDACWPWTGHKDRDGYGQVKVNGQARQAIWVAAWLRDGRPPAAGKVVMHSCRNKACVNPRHLTVGTHQENREERAERERGGRVREHMGPGPHKSGSKQQVHSGGAMAGAAGKQAPGAKGAPDAAGGGGSGSADAAGGDAKAKLKDALANWDTLTQEQKDAVADPANSIPARAEEILAPLGEWGGKSAGERVRDAMDKGLVMEATGETLTRRATELDALLSEFGAEPGAARVISQRFTDLMLAQEVESMERTLGDHGIRHLSGDIQLATALLEEMDLATPHNRLVTIMAGALHDTGYLTPPSRNWKDRDHPRWSGQYLESDAQLSEALGGILGDEGMKLLRHVIDSHYETDTDWQADPVAAAFRVADNMALFHNEKTPGLLHYVPENLGPLERLKAGKIDVGQAQKEIVANVAKANLPKPVKAQLTRAAGEVSPILNKLTPGMRAGQLAGVGKVGGVPTVFVRRTAHYDRIQRVFGVGERQFVKLAEAYKGEGGARGAVDRLWQRGWETFGGFRVEAVNITRRKPTRRIREALEGSMRGFDAWLLEHDGPGPHENGSPQAAHGGGGGGGGSAGGGRGVLRAVVKRALRSMGDREPGRVRMAYPPARAKAVRVALSDAGIHYRERSSAGRTVFELEQDDIISWLDESGEFEDLLDGLTEGAAAARGFDAWLLEHYGPGPHPGGTPQVSHTGGRVARRARAWARLAKSKGQSPSEAYQKGDTEAAITARGGKGTASAGEPQSDYAKRRLAYEARMAGKAEKRREWAEKRRKSAEERREAVRPLTDDYAFNTQPGISSSPAGKRVNRALDKAHEDSKMAQRHESVAGTLDARAAHGQDTAVMQGKIKQAEADMRRAQRALDGRVEYYENEQGKLQARLAKPQGEHKAKLEKLLKDAQDAQKFWQDRLKTAGGPAFSKASFKKGQTVTYTAGAGGAMKGRVTRVNPSSVTIELDPEDIPKHLRGLMKTSQKIPYAAMKRDNTTIEEGAAAAARGFDAWLLEHYGPGPHPKAGTPQVSHSGGRVARRAQAWARAVKAKGGDPSKAYAKGETEAAIAPKRGYGSKGRFGVTTSTVDGQTTYGVQGGSASRFKTRAEAERVSRFLRKNEEGAMLKKRADQGKRKDYGSAPAPEPVGGGGTGSGLGGRGAVGPLMKVSLANGDGSFNKVRPLAEVTGALALHPGVGSRGGGLTVTHVPTGMSLGLDMGGLSLEYSRKLTAELAPIWKDVGSRISRAEMDRLAKETRATVDRVKQAYQDSKTSKRAKAMPYEVGGRGAVGERQDISIKVNNGPAGAGSVKVKAEVIGELALHKSVGGSRYAGHTITHVPTGLALTGVGHDISLKAARQLLKDIGKEWRPVGATPDHDRLRSNGDALRRILQDRGYHTR